MNLPRIVMHPHVTRATRVIVWFSIGAVLGLFFFLSFLLIYYQKHYENRVYPGVIINGMDFGGKTKEEVADIFAKKNTKIQNTSFTLEAHEYTATVSAKSLTLGYNEKLLSDQAYSIGRSNDVFSNYAMIMQAYMNGVNLEPSYSFADKAFQDVLSPMQKAVNIPPVDAQFRFTEGRVTAFRPSSNGREVHVEKLKNEIQTKTMLLLASGTSRSLIISVPVTVKKPSIPTEEVNDLGIKELVGRGTSLFQGSIQNRIYNLTLAASRLNGILIKPGETFSFNKAVGDVSSLTGYKQAYIISGGRTQLGDGGGVCQVSTTFFRAVLDAGLPVVERNPHAYRVGYYEQDSAPGVDAAIYTPTIDFKFKNDTQHHLLIQTYVNPDEYRLTFELYGTKDGREVVINKPVITSSSPAPEPLYQDDPTLPKGQVKQVDFAAPGAVVYFTREVKKDGKVIISDKFTSRYRPWQAVYLRGTKEG